jgi:hypothetical protein
MMASYGEPNYKAKSATTGVTQQFKGNPKEPEVKKTTGTAIRTREAYRRRREDSSDIGDKTKQKSRVGK